MSTFIPKRSVTYNNHLNKAIFPGWDLIDHNILYSVLSCLKEKGVEFIELDVKEMKALTDYKKKGLQEWRNKIKEVGDKIMAIRYYEEKGKGFTIMALFTLFRLSEDGNNIEVQLSKHWEYILNNFDANFTTFDLMEFLSIRSVYSKNLFRLLKQWRTIGYKKISLEDFKLQLDIPESYSTSAIQNRVLKQIDKDLPEHFANFKWRPLKSDYQGRRIIGYEFTWTPEVIEKFDPDKYKNLDKGNPNNYSNSILKQYDFSPNHSRKYTKVGEMNYLKLDNFKDTKSSRNRYDLSHWVDENGEVVVFETWMGSLLRERRYDDDHVEKVYPKNMKINIPEDILKELKEYTPEEVQIISNDPEGEALIKELIEEGFFDD